MSTRIPFEPTREKLTRILLLTPEEDMYADVLDLLLGVFESEFGYFGYIDNEGHLVCPSMTRHIFPVCQVADKDIVFRREIWGGLWGRILLERRSLVKNVSYRVPDGHLPIGRSFGSPILYRSELIGSSTSPTASVITTTRMSRCSSRFATSWPPY